MLGGGFGGLSVANELRRRLAPERARVTVVDRRDWFMVGFAKLWIIRGTRTLEESSRSLRNLARREIDFIMADVQRIDLQNQRVETSRGTIAYDYLVIAMGARLEPKRISGLAEHGLNLYDHEQLPAIRQRLTNIRSGTIAIVIASLPYKCPPAPFEAALLISSMMRDAGTAGSVRVCVYSPAPITLPAAGQAVSHQVLEMLRVEGVEFHGSHKIRSVQKNGIEFDAETVSFDVLLAIPPHMAPRAICDTGLVGIDGFVSVGRDCQTLYDRVYAIGDITTMPAGEAAVPKAGIFAEGQGLAVAKNIVSEIESRRERSTFDGKGACFMESGRGTASLVEVDAFSHARPLTKLTTPTEGHLREKMEFERERLARWLT